MNVIKIRECKTIFVSLIKYSNNYYILNIPIFLHIKCVSCHKDIYVSLNFP